MKVDHFGQQSNMWQSRTGSAVASSGVPACLGPLEFCATLPGLLRYPLGEQDNLTGGGAAFQLAMCLGRLGKFEQVLQSNVELS